MRFGGWQFGGRESSGLLAGLCLILAFGANLEQRTALRREPMTDLGVFSCAAWAVWSGDNLYRMTDWHGWHYNYPPAMAILFGPLAQPLPEPLPALNPGERRSEANTPWGYGLPHQRFFGLHKENLRFFLIVAAWYFLSVGFCLFAAHAVACVLEGRRMSAPPPEDLKERRRWWGLRLLPILVCAGSIGTDLSRGQMELLMLAAIALAIYLAANAMDGKAGLILSFPGCVKLIPPVLLLYPFWSRRWRMSAGVVAGLILFLAVIPVAVCGPGRTIELYQTWVRVVIQPGMGKGADTSRSGELTGMNGTDNQSLLAAIHNWSYHNVPRSKRPKDAAPVAHKVAYGIGALLLAVLLMSSRRSRGEASSMHMILCVTGFTAVWLVATPVAHNFYYLLMLPLVSAVLYKSGLFERRNPDWKLLGTVVAFMVVDFLARLPSIGNWLRDCGAPLLSLLALFACGIYLLIRERRDEITAVRIHQPTGLSAPI